MMSSDTTKKPGIPEGEPLRLNEWGQPAAAMVALFAAGIGLLLLLTHPTHGSNLAGPPRPVYGAAWIAFAFLAASGVWSAHY